MDSCKQIYKYLLKQNNQVVALITHGRALHQQQKNLFNIINQHFKCDYRVGHCSQDELIILVASAEIANRIRYKSMQLLLDIKKLESFKLLKNIVIKVSPLEFDETSKNKPNNKKPINTSISGSKNLNQLADSVDDAALKSSLRRLAGHLQK